MHRFYVLGIFFFVQHIFFRSGLRIVTHQLRMILIAVQLDNVNLLFIGSPTDVSKITVGRIACLKINSLSALHVVHTNCYLMACHACHRIFISFECSDACSSVYLRIIGHHALIHAIES